MDISITMSDGSQQVADIIPFDLVGFERHYRMGFDEVRDTPLVEHTMFLAWHSLNRADIVNIKPEDRGSHFEKWMATVKDIDAPKVEASPAPNRSQRRSRASQAAK